MNITALLKNEEIHTSLSIVILFYIILCFTCVLLFFLLFPFYVYVNKVNRERDKTAIVFPITNHFYVIIKVIYILFFLSISWTVLMVIFANRNSPLCAIFFALILLTHLIIFIIVQTCTLLTSLLAIQRSAIYFFPSAEKTILAVQKKLHTNIWYLWVSVGFKDLFGIALLLYCLQSDKIETSCSSYQSFYLLTFAVFNFLLVFSAFLYIPIMIQVQKLSYLPSVQQSKPHKYILWQTVTILVLKSFFLPFIIVNQYFNPVSPIGVLFYFVITDTFILPLIIQVSYLGCNRRNLTTLLQSFHLETFVAVLLNMKMESTVTPQESLTFASGDSTRQ
ncbi:hypothetical protein CRE_16978 [Caenorhabditis remanei]|uniref:Serpentine Receptor, class Z n=1 Tax=Caenorhabditis remanei TaxID=31234 RepID=E3N2E1_CAERE|nr:hypothetical protein CRE_16978 [Caenorhabditis remanei]